MKKLTTTATCIMALLASTTAAYADDDALRQQLNALAQKLEGLQAEVRSLKSQNRELQAQQKVQNAKIQAKASAAAPAPAVAPVATVVAAPAPAPAAAPAIDTSNFVTKGDLPGSFKIPGTDTSIKFGGYAKLDAIGDISGGGLGGTPAVFPAISVRGANNQSKREGQWWLTARQSRLNLETRTPTDYGPLKIFVEGDFYGAGGNEFTSNSTGFRLRLAYADIGPFTAGQAFTTFLDPATGGETLDFGGPIGPAAGLRQALIRYTHKFGNNEAAVGIENPESEFLGLAANNNNGAVHDNYVAAGNVVPSNFIDKVPDLVARYGYSDTWGRLFVSGVLRYLTINNTNVTGGSIGGFTGQDSTLAGGFGVGGAINTFGKDKFTFGATAGPGLGRYQAGVGGTNNAAYIEGGQIKPLFSWGVNLGYQHWWTNTLRSNLIYGHSENDNHYPAVPRSTFKTLDSVHVNLLWSPLPKSTVGVEYIYGALKNGNIPTATLSNEGSASRIQFSAQYGF